MDPGADGAAPAGLTAQASRQPVGGGLLQAGAGFIGNAGITLIGAGTGAVLTIGAGVLAARFLGVGGYGLYALALMLTRSSAVVAQLGVQVSVMHHLPVHLSRDHRQHALGTILGSMPLSLGSGLVLALGLGLGAPWVATHALGQPGAGRFLTVLAVAIPLQMAADLFADTGRAFGRALPAVLIQNLAPPLCTFAVVVSLMLWHGPQIGVAYGQLGGFGIGAALGIWFIARVVRERIGWIRPVFELRRLYGYGLPITLNAAAYLAIGYTGLYLLGRLTDAGVVGAYRGCMQIVLVFGLPLNALALATAPVYTVLIAEGRHAILQETYSATLRLATLVALPLLMIIVVNGSDLLRVMGPAFTAGTPALLVLACGLCVELAFSPSATVLGMGGRQRLDAGNLVLAAGLNLILNLTLIPAYGLLGAALSTTTSWVALAAIRGFQLRRILALRTIDRTLLRIILVSLPPALLIATAAVPLGLGPGSGFGPLALRVAAMTVLIGGALWRFCLDVQDRAMVRQLILLRSPAPASPITAATDNP